MFSDTCCESAMWWERIHARARPRESATTAEGRKLAARGSGWGGPGRRWGHTCNSVKGGRLIYVFAGYGADNAQTNDVHVFDTLRQTWSKPIIKGIPPSQRDSHSCTTVGDRLFVFGGTDGKTPLKDLHILDTSTNTWIQPALQGDGPDAREGHSAALVDKRLFIFGGCGKSKDFPEEVYYNDLFILDTEALVWKRAVTSGFPPSPRDSHTCSPWRNKIIVLGGEDSSDCYLSDVHILDAETLTWRQINTSGQMLAPRAGHTTVALGSRLFVFGGFTDDRNLYDDLHVLNLDTGFWSRVANVNQGPCARFSVAGDCLDEQKGILVFMGGCNKNLEALDDMYYLHTDPIDYEAKPTGMRTFEARITNTNEYGYEIETIVDGKLLHGMVFSCTAVPAQGIGSCHNKRRIDSDNEFTTPNQHQPRRKVSEHIIKEEAKSSDKRQMEIIQCSNLSQQQQNAEAAKTRHDEAANSDQKQVNSVHDKETSTQNSQSEAFHQNSTNTVPEVGGYQQNMQSGSLEHVTGGGGPSHPSMAEPRNPVEPLTKPEEPVSTSGGPET